MEGWFVRVEVEMSYVPPSVWKLPLRCEPLLGL
jgi:hypothetical protein